ncbi:C45 family peptidase [Brevibacterium litoralis]|uniref:C45 family peptidase n=1 Tax=Brevibacterium litoralis TaxID=3138935 RepID=UPI0032EFB34F
MTPLTQSPAPTGPAPTVTTPRVRPHVPDRFDPERIIDPATAAPEFLHVTGTTREERGTSRGRAAAAGIRYALDAYTTLFATKGIDARAQEEAARASLAALEDWDPGQVQELGAVAAAAGLEDWQVGLLAARTEVLTLADSDPQECSTLAFRGAERSFSVQTWDWNVEFAEVWHLHTVDALTAGSAPADHRALHAHAGFAEYGMLGKIGMNDAGIGVHLNILKNTADVPGGVPVHAILTAVLERAGTVEEAIDLVLSAPTTSSSVITVTGPGRSVMIELSPTGKQVIEADGWLVHTNHFVGTELQEGAAELSATSTSQARYALLTDRVADAPAPTSTADFLPLLSTSGDQAPVCCVVDPAKPFGQRSGTLVTVQLDPDARRVVLNPGNPKDTREETTTVVEFA